MRNVLAEVTKGHAVAVRNAFGNPPPSWSENGSAWSVHGTDTWSDEMKPKVVSASMTSRVAHERHWRQVWFRGAHQGPGAQPCRRSRRLVLLGGPPLQAAAAAARRGHNQLATDLKKVIDTSRNDSFKATLPSARVTPLAQPRGDIADVVATGYPDVSLKDLVGPDELLEQVRQVVLEQRQRRRLIDHGFTPAHRLLLEGPPGTGKTMTAAVLAHELSMPLFTVRLESVLSRYLGETAGKLRALFDAAADQRAVFLFDEFDALGGDRGGNDVGEARRTLSVFLEGASPDSIVVAATNHRSILDRALFRRFDVVLTYSLPDDEAASVIMRRRLGGLGRGIAWGEVIEPARGLSHAELVATCDGAAKRALLTGDRAVSTVDLRTSLTARRRGSVA